MRTGRLSGRGGLDGDLEGDLEGSSAEEDAFGDEPVEGAVMLLVEPKRLVGERWVCHLPKHIHKCPSTSSIYFSCF